MKKILALLLVVGFVIGTFSVVEELCEESSFQDADFSDDGARGDDYGDPMPCGGSEGSGGGGGLPG